MQFFSWCFFYSCNYAPHVNSSRDLHEVIVGTTSTDAFLLHFNQELNPIRKVIPINKQESLLNAKPEEAAKLKDRHCARGPSIV